MVRMRLNKMCIGMKLFVKKVVKKAQSRNEGCATSPDAELLWGGELLRGRRKVLTMSQVLSSTTDLLPKDLRFEHGGTKLVSCPRRNLTSLRLCLSSWVFTAMRLIDIRKNLSLYPP